MKFFEHRLPIRAVSAAAVNDFDCPRAELRVFMVSQLLEPIGVDLGRRQLLRLQSAKQVFEPIAAAEQHLGRLAAHTGTHRLPARNHQPAHGGVVHRPQRLQRGELNCSRLASV